MGKNQKNKKQRFYHGGYPELGQNDLLRAYGDTSISLRQDYSLFDPRRIFVTTSLDLATAYALQFARKAPGLVPGYEGPAEGAVYEVDVKGPKYADEDFSELAQSRGGPFSYAVLASPVIKNVVCTLDPDPHREYKLFAPFQTWESPDGRVYPLWTSDGYMMPNAFDTKNGLTWQMIEQQHKLGPFPGMEVLIKKRFYLQ